MWTCHVTGTCLRVPSSAWQPSLLPSRLHCPSPEHQPPSWSSYFTDLHIASLLAPAGLLLCFRPLTDASLFLLLYGVTAVYFSGVMVRACGCEGQAVVASQCLS